MKKTLRTAAICNIAWGLWLAMSPDLPFANLSSVLMPSLLRFAGLTVCLWGVGYAIASLNPLQHWGTVLIGLVGKVVTPVGLIVEMESSSIPSSMILMIFFNYVIWWGPFGLILYRIYQSILGKQRIVCPDVQRLALRARTTSGHTLSEISYTVPVMLVFLRTVGCNGCHRALKDLAQKRDEIESSGVRIVLVHMEEEFLILPLLTKSGLQRLDRVSDTRKSVYRAFGLRRAGLFSTILPALSWHVFKSRIIHCRDESGDWFQMPGVFLIFHGEVIRSYIHQNPTDRPDYIQLASGDAYAQTGTAT